MNPITAVLLLEATRRVACALIIDVIVVPPELTESAAVKSVLSGVVPVSV